jgi:putative intracellular protease/amidase
MISEVAMKKPGSLLRQPIFVMIFTFSLIALAGPGCALASQTASAKQYVCPPCGGGCDEEVYDKPGACRVCGMSLVEKGSQAARPAEHRQEDMKRVAILIFNGVQIIDYAGPYEVFGQAGCNVYTVAPSAEAITTAMGMRVLPSYTLDNSPRPDIIVIPGGGVTETQNDPRVIKWIQDNAKDAEHVLSVCNGAFILAKTGLLDGLSATTFYGLIEGFVAFAPKTKVVTDQRYVDNGKIITTAGISSGIDGSLYVVSKMMGKAQAQMVALNMEYNWQPESKYARASFADIHLRRVFGRGLRITGGDGTRISVLSTEGGPDSWQARWQVQTASPPAQVLEMVGEQLKAAKWEKQEGGSAGAAATRWLFTDEKGGGWSGAATIEPVRAEPNRFVLTIKIDRARRG